MTFFQEIQELMKQGGLVLWLMLVLSVLLYTILASTWWGLWSVKKEINDFEKTLDEVHSKDCLEDEMDLFALSRFAWVQRRLPVLSVLIALAPLSGLLGTVAGMLNTFSGMSSASTVKPLDSISSGISQALLTTQAGLLMAIPAALLFTMLKSKFEHVRGIFEQSAARRNAILSTS